MLISPSALTLVQTTFLDHIGSAFSVITDYALNLLYIFAAFELVVFGLLWAFQLGTEWGRLFFKIIKIGIIFFIIQNYPYLLNTIIKSFAILGGTVAHVHNLSQFIFTPTHIWQYGYDTSLWLIKNAMLSSAFGMALVFTLLGSGILITFGLIGIQIVLQIVGFYLISLVALILMPFGVFKPSSNMLEKSLQNVFKSGVRVMVLIIVIGIAVTIFNQFDVVDLSKSTAGTDYNITFFLGLFFTSLLFLCLAWVLPKLAADAVGEISMSIGEVTAGPVIAAAPTGYPAPIPAGTTGGMQDVQAASRIEVGVGGVTYGSTGAQPSQAQIIAAASQPTPAVQTSGRTGIFAEGAGGGIAEGAAAARKQSIPTDTLKKLHSVLEKISKTGSGKS